MKKILLCILSVIMLCGFSLAGCSKADSATLADCHKIYTNMYTEYGMQNNGKHIVFNGDKIDLYSETCYDEQIYQAIENEKTGFVLLKQGKQYQLLVEAATAFYDNYDTFLNGITQTYEKNVPQSLKTKLYNQFMAIETLCREVKDAKQVFETACKGVLDATSINVKTNLTSFLKSYVKLINKAVAVNVLYEEIYTKYIIVANDTSIVEGDYQRVVYSAELYVAKYLALWLNQNNQNLMQDFSNSDTFNKLSQIINSANSMGDVDYSNEDNILKYQKALQKLNNFKLDVQNYEEALNKKTDDESNPYTIYANGFKTNVINFENYFLVNLLSVSID